MIFCFESEEEFDEYMDRRSDVWLDATRNAKQREAMFKRLKEGSKKNVSDSDRRRRSFRDYTG